MINKVITLVLLIMIININLSAKTFVSDKTRLKSLQKLTNVISAVEKYYVDKVEFETIVEKAISGMMSNLDAHSSYLNASSFKEMQVRTNGQFGGLGINIAIKDGALTIISPIEGTPADKVGIKPMDIILKINNQSTLNMTIDESVKLMRGKPKTKISLTIVRKGEKKPLVFNIVRDIIKIKSVYTKYIKQQDILYIRVTSFDKKVVKGVKQALEQKHKDTKGIILDLRNNPGGLLNQAIGLVDLFVDDGIIVSQKGRYKKEDIDFKATSSNTYKDIPMAVLINQGSASASEIVSGALQDHKRAIIIGQKSFGKGSVQVILPIGKKDALRLTIARYYLPSGRTIQAKGVIPDLFVMSGKVITKDDKFVIQEAQLKKHLENILEKENNKKTKQKKSKKKSKDKYITQKQINEDIQLKTAIDTIKTISIIKK